MNLFWINLGNIYRFFIKILNINFSVSHRISTFGPFKIHCFFAFSNFTKWGSEGGSIFSLMMSKCKNKKCIFDIGAHVGLMTLPINSKVNSDTKIFCFEPSRINRKFLKFHLKKNKIINALIIKDLVGNKCLNRVNFFESKEPTGLNSIVNFKNNNFKIEKKNQITLDDFVFKNNLKPDLIKIDVEGSEIFILQGAIKAIKKYKPDIFLSIHKKHFQILGLNENQLKKIIKKLNYKIINSNNKIVKEFTEKEYYLSPRI